MIIEPPKIKKPLKCKCGGLYKQFPGLADANKYITFMCDKCGRVFKRKFKWE